MESLFHILMRACLTDLSLFPNGRLRIKRKAPSVQIIFSIRKTVQNYCFLLEGKKQKRHVGEYVTYVPNEVPLFP